MSLWPRFSDLALRVGDVEAILAPKRVALRFKGIPGRLLDIRDRLAEYGIGPDDRVAAVLPHGPETAMCFLGVASCASYVPLNPDYSEAEFTHYFAALKPKAVILPKGDAQPARRCAESLRIPILDLTVDQEGPAGSFSLSRGSATGLPPVPPRWNGGDDIALILMTSGTTGRQKFVPTKPRHLLAYADAARHDYKLTPADRCLHVMPMFHGHGLKSGLIVPLASGTGVVCADRFDVATFFRDLADYRPTWYSASYSIHAAICDRIDEYPKIVRESDLRFMRSGSGRLDVKVAAKLEKAFRAPIVERYGMSETGSLTANLLAPDLRRLGTAGRPFCNEVAILDATGAALGANCIGEIVARGPTVFDGYLDDPEANEAAFIDGWFRTGDLGRFDDDGFLTVVGRIKDVINRGGEKIAALEVESAILQHPAVRDACVFPIAHPMLGEEVAAAIIWSSGVSAPEADLRKHCLGLLTGFKVPRLFFFVDSFPRSASNKVQRDRVAQICRDQMRDESLRQVHEDRGGWSATEREIAKLWNAVLRADVMSRDDDFFLVGGDSTKAAELFARLRSIFKVDLNLGDIFDDASTIAGMARLVESGTRTAGKPGLPSRLLPIKATGDRSPLFAIPGSGGNPLGFVNLARLLDEGQPMIGIESRGIDGISVPLDRMEDIAADNIARMRTVQPHGPYFLMGACYGARVAYEVARQLVDLGEDIGLLIMLDPSAPFYDETGRPRRAASRRRAVHRDNTVAGIIRDRIVSYGKDALTLKGDARREFIGDKLATLRDIIRQRDLFRGDRTEYHQRAAQEANFKAGRHYIPGPFGGPAVLCFTRDRPLKSARNYRMDWLSLLPQAGQPTMVPGKDSGDMTKFPHVHTLAPYVNQWLDTAQHRRTARLQRTVHPSIAE